MKRKTLLTSFKNSERQNALMKNFAVIHLLSFQLHPRNYSIIYMPWFYIPLAIIFFYNFRYQDSGLGLRNSTCGRLSTHLGSLLQ